MYIHLKNNPWYIETSNLARFKSAKLSATACKLFHYGVIKVSFIYCTGLASVRVCLISQASPLMFPDDVHRRAGRGEGEIKQKTTALLMDARHNRRVGYPSTHQHTYPFFWSNVTDLFDARRGGEIDLDHP